MKKYRKQKGLNVSQKIIVFISVSEIQIEEIIFILILKESFIISKKSFIFYKKSFVLKISKKSFIVYKKSFVLKKIVSRKS